MLTGFVFMFINFVSEDQIILLFRLWPVLLIALGAETLITIKLHPEYTFSLSSIIIIAALVLFAFCMAGVEVAFNYFVKYGLYNMF